MVRRGRTDTEWFPTSEYNEVPVVATLVAAGLTVATVATLLAELALFRIDLPGIDSPPGLERVVRWFGRQPGVGAGFAFLVCSLAASAAALLAPWSRMLFGALTVTAGIAVIARLPVTLAMPGSRPSLWTYAVTAVPVLVLMGKQVLLRRAAARWHNEDRRTTKDLEALLPTQEANLERVVDAIFRAKRADREHIVQVSGRWGDGKSFLIQHLEAAIAVRCGAGTRPAYLSTFAVVKVDVWKQESEAEMHQAIVEEVLAHPASFYPWGWLRFPLTMLVPARIGTLTLRLVANLGSKADLEVPLRLPRLLYQRTLADVVAHARRHDIRLIIVLDEVDRATNSVAQTAITLMRRSFDLPGATVVIVYVNDIVDYKAFNPLVEQLPDLASSSEAILWNHLPGVASTLGTASPPPLGSALRAGFAARDTTTQLRLVSAMAEKFLSSSPVRVTPMTLDDVVHLLTTASLDVAETIDVIAGFEASRAVAESFAAHLRNDWDEDSVPPIRPLIGWFRRLLRAAASADMELPPEDIVWVALVAYALAESGIPVREAA